MNSELPQIFCVFAAFWQAKAGRSIRPALILWSSFTHSPLTHADAARQFTRRKRRGGDGRIGVISGRFGSICSEPGPASPNRIMRQDAEGGMKVKVRRRPGRARMCDTHSRLGEFITLRWIILPTAVLRFPEGAGWYEGTGAGRPAITSTGMPWPPSAARG